MRLLNPNEIDFGENGFVSHKEAAQTRQVRLYQSKTPITSLSHYVGPAKDYIKLSKTISPQIQAELCNFTGIVSIGRTMERDQQTDQRSYHYRNAQLYVSSCKTLDGYRRICYIAQKEGEDFCRVKESSRSRGDGYSAYFSLLREAMQASGRFKEVGPEYFVDASNAKLFVELLNQINKNSSITGYYQLVLDNNLQTVKGRYYRSCHWIETTPPPGQAAGRPAPLEQAPLEELLRLIYDKVSASQSLEEMENAKALLKGLQSLVDSKRVFLQQK